ncbi:sec-independent translocation protein MttA/Hcf106 [Isoptericola variabilis]|uniref:Sec-independent translocation protein MttA/Hcf106 n=1 Tax=Isoptericola variabilis (strain 225) TaxID=743718 RepID=F6FPU9_ISOV2|nr:sec-independent translocation protein MttA/Hcf106 [Isoptericola variabilis]AEG43738.1 sec-independent translocation protein MttA/Hcf106 [Isoptericola variabilis 225]TWH27418.1 sec-independent protein translocase protein TatB [Isoptericola variabilis J7]
MIDINGGEFVVLVVLAVLLIGPERLPGYAAQLASLVKRGKVLLQDAKTRVDAELGDDFKDVDWSKLDPRQYDPRRIVRDALLDDTPVPARAAAAGAAGAASSAAHAPRPTGPAPFDDEAT